MKQMQGRCPLCGSPAPISAVDEATVIRAEILFLRRRLDELERAGGSSQSAEGVRVFGDQAPAALEAQEQLQERIDQGLQHLDGGYGTEDRL
jgi:hypothetical protein